MQIPTQVKVGGISYRVELCEPETKLDDKTAARLSSDKCWIRILKGDKPFMEEAFLHELFHTINIEMSEETVEFLAQALYQIVVDNPSIFEGGEVKHDRRNKR